MAVVTGMTAVAMQAIRNGSVVSAAFDSANHLILTKYDGTQIDAGTVGAATTVAPGQVELATSAETQTGTDATRAITPAGLASLPGYRVQIVSGIAESADPSAWPYGVSLQSVTSGSGWTPNNGFGTIVTSSISVGRTVQEFYKSSGGTTTVQSWERTYNNADGGGGWTAWRERTLVTTLNAASFTQLTAASVYPNGRSKLFYTSANGGSWDFNGMYGEVETQWDSINSFARQTFTQRNPGSSNIPEVWHRTSDNTIGWSAWKKLIHDPGAWITYTPTWSTTSGAHLPSFGNATTFFKAYKIGRKVDVQFDVTFGTTTNFGSGPLPADNWTFSLPPAWPASATPPSTYLGVGDMYRNITNLGFTRIKLTGTTTVTFGILTCFVSGALASGIGGDVDSVTPWTWASADVIRGAFTYESAS